MSNNPLLFNAAFSAACAAGEAGRIINSTVSADYDELRAAALVFATTLDNAIPTDASTSQADANLMLSCCLTVLSGRYSLATSNYGQLTQAIKTLYDNARGSLEPESGGSSVPLVAAMFVDPATTVAPASQNGSAIAPFSTIQAALDVLPASGTVLLTPGVYAAEALTVATPQVVSFVGLTYLGGECDLTAVSVTTNSRVSISNIGALGAVLLLAPGGSIVTIENSRVLNDCGVGTIDAHFCTFDGDIDAETTVNGSDTQFQNLTSGAGAANYFLIRCNVANATSGTGQAAFTDCALLGNLAIGTSIDLRLCVTPALVTITTGLLTVANSNLSGATGAGAIAATTLQIDSESYQTIQEPDDLSISGDTIIADIQQPETLVRYYRQEDDFDFLGVADAAAIPTAGLAFLTGAGGWNAIALLAAGSFVTTLATTQDKAGILGIRTAAATINAIAGIAKGNLLSASTFIRADQTRFFDCIVRIPDITTTRVWFGWSSDALSVAPTSAIYFVYDSSVSANWLAVTRSGGVENAVDTGVPVVAATFYKLAIRRPNIAAAVDFYINNANKQHVTTRVPASGVNLTFMAKTLTGAGARGFDIDWEAAQGYLNR